MPQKKVKKKVKKAVRRRNQESGSGTEALFGSGVPSRFSNLPEGTYDGLIKPGSFIIEPKPDDPRFKRALCTLVVTGPPEHADREQVKRNDLSTQVGVNIFLGELETLEFQQPHSLAEAGEVLAQTDNLPVRFWVGPQKDEFPPKVRFNEKLEGSPEAPAPVEEPAAAEDVLTAKDIRGFTENELLALNKDEALELREAEYDTWEGFAEACIEELGL